MRELLDRLLGRMGLAGTGASASGHGVLSRVRSGALWLLGGNVVGTLFGVVQGLLLARLLGLHDYGVLSVVLAYAALITQLFDSRSWDAVVNFVTEFRQRGETEKATAAVKALFLIDIGTGLASFVVISLSAAIVGTTFAKSPEAGRFLAIYAFAIPLAAPGGVSVGLMRVAGRNRGLALIDAISAAVQLGGVATVLLLGRDLRWLIVWLVLVAGAKAFVSAGVAMDAARKLGLGHWRGARLRLLRNDWQRMRRFWLFTNGFALLKGLQQNGDTMLIGLWLGPTAVAVFRLARTLANAFSFPLVPLYQAAYPEFSRLWHSGAISTLRRFTARLTFYSSAVMAVGLAAFLLLASWIVTLAAGASYAPATPLVRVMAVGVALNVITQYAHAALVAAGQIRRAFLAFSLPLAAQAITLVLLVRATGPLAGALALLVFAVTRGALLGSWSMTTLRKPDAPRVAVYPEVAV